MSDPTTPEPGAGPPPEAAPGQRDPARTFFHGVAPDDLGLGDAISSGFRVLVRPGFVLVVLVLTMIITLTVEAAIGSIIRDRLRVTTEALEARAPVLISSAIVAFIGNLVVSTYGQVWLVLASSIGEPSFRTAIERTLDRMLAVLAAGLLTAILFVAIALPFLVLGFPVAALILVPVTIYGGSRLSFSTWLAADGRGPIAAIKESWAISRGHVLQIVGWNLAIGIVILLVSAAISIALGAAGFGGAIAQGITVAIDFGASIALLRSVQSKASHPDPRRDARGYLV